MIAERQHGVVSTRQLLGAGMDKDGILRWVKAGRLHRIHRGVYAVGHGRLPLEGRWVAAVLACGGGAGSGGSVLRHWKAVLTHRSAAELWGLLPAREHPIDVTVPGDGGRAKRKGIRLHRSRTLVSAAVTLRNGIPVTTPARTIADLRRSVSGQRRLLTQRELRRAIRQAEVLGLPIGDGGIGNRTRSDLEEDFLGLCRRHGLPLPEVNVRIGRNLVDFLWRERRLVVETDSYLYHRGRVAFQDDRERDLDLRVRGFDVLRVSEKQLEEEPARVAAIVGHALRVGADAAESA